jgi:DNA-binding NarL/FixJ family response regulator
VALITEHPNTGRRLRDSISRASDLVVVADVPNIRGAVAQTFSLRPRVFVVEVVEDALVALDALRRANDVDPLGRPVVLLFATRSTASLPQALAGGVHGLVLAGDSTTLIADAVRLVVAGYRVVPPQLRQWAQDYRESNPADRSHRATVDRLTRRERDVLLLVAEGMTNAEISVRLRLSENTVKSHLQRILEKLGLRNRAAVVVFAHDFDLV